MRPPDVECGRRQAYGQCGLGETTSSDSGKPHRPLEHRHGGFPSGSLAVELFDGVVLNELASTSLQAWPFPVPIQSGLAFGEFHRTVAAVRARPADFGVKV